MYLQYVYVYRKRDREREKGICREIYYYNKLAYMIIETKNYRSRRADGIGTV